MSNAVGTELLSYVAENLRGSKRVYDLALNLHLEALNVGLKTAHMGTEAKTFVPISSEVSESMKRLKKITSQYQLISVQFIHSLANQLKAVRLNGLFEAASDQTEQTSLAIREQFADLNRTLGYKLDGASHEIEATRLRLSGITIQLKDIAFSGKYTSDLARIESVKMIGGKDALSTAAGVMSKLLIQLGHEVEQMSDRLDRCHELLQILNNRDMLPPTESQL